MPARRQAVIQSAKAIESLLQLNVAHYVCERFGERVKMAMPSIKLIEMDLDGIQLIEKQIEGLDDKAFEKNFLLLQQNPPHPSLQLKRLEKFGPRELACAIGAGCCRNG